MIMRVIKASELGSFLYCQRAWWYQLRGEPSANQDAMESGTQRHQIHARRVKLVPVLIVIAVLLALIAIVVILVRK
jgi:hypothetical protein